MVGGEAGEVGFEAQDFGGLFEEGDERRAGEGGDQVVDDARGFLGDVPAVGVGAAGAEEGFVEEAGVDEALLVLDAVVERLGFGRVLGARLGAVDEAFFEGHDALDAAAEAGEEGDAIRAAWGGGVGVGVGMGFGLEFFARAVGGEFGHFHAEIDKAGALAEPLRAVLVVGGGGEVGGGDGVHFVQFV